MKHVFIDCGAWKGDSIIAFRSYHKNQELYDIYGFECHPILKKDLRELQKTYNFKLIEKAAWDKDETIKMFLGMNDDLTQSSSLFKEKKKYIDKKNPVLVESIDFSEWIRSNFSRSDYIICKMNIEGAEYNILEKMIKDKTIEYIDVLYIAWHNHKIKNFPQDKHNKIKNFVDSNLRTFEWGFKNKPGENPFID